MAQYLDPGIIPAIDSSAPTMARVIVVAKTSEITVIGKVIAVTIDSIMFIHSNYITGRNLFIFTNIYLKYVIVVI